MTCRAFLCGTSLLAAAAAPACAPGVAAPAGCPAVTARVTRAPAALGLAERCRLVRVALAQLAAVPAGRSEFAPADTALVAGVAIFATARLAPPAAASSPAREVGERTPFWEVEVDVPGRARLFQVTLDSLTGATAWATVHR